MTRASPKILSIQIKFKDRKPEYVQATEEDYRAFLDSWTTSLSQPVPALIPIPTATCRILSHDGTEFNYPSQSIERISAKPHKPNKD